jgi:hypothetical protein
MPPVLSLGGTRRGQAPLGLQQPGRTSRRISSSKAWLATRQSGWLAALASSAWALVCSSRPIRFGFILAPRHPIPYAPAAAVESASEMPQGPPGGASLLGCKGSCRAVRLQRWQAPHRARNWVSVAPVAPWAWFRLHTPRPRAFHPGPRGAALLGGLSPAGLVIPGPAHIPFERAGPWLMPWTWSGQTPPRTGPQKYPALMRLLWPQQNRLPREVPSICEAIVGGGTAVGSRHSLEAALDGGSALNRGSAPWPG